MSNIDIRSQELLLLNKFFYERYILPNTSKFEQIYQEIKEINIDWAESLLPLIEFPLQFLSQDKFYFTDFYLNILKEKEKYYDIIDYIIEKYEKDSLYEKINILYNDWRNLVNQIWDSINQKYEEYLNILNKLIIQEAEYTDRQNEEFEIKEIEKILENL